jgi:acetylornithine deacetylase
MDLRSALNAESLYATLGDLVSINSVNPQYLGGPGEGALAEYVGSYLRKNSIPFEFQTVFTGRPNVVARLDGTEGGRTLVLEAHMDTATGLGMTREPFRPVREGNRLYGRGSCDTKGGLAAMLHVLKAVCDTQVRLSTSVVFVAAADEEYGFRGVTKFLEKGIKADGAIVAEPTDLETVIASKGVLRWRLRTRGKTAHSSMPHLGVNAITKMAKVILAIEETLPRMYETRQHPLLGSPTVSVGIIQGGVEVNQVPGSCTADIDRRLLPGETKESVWNEFEGLLAELRAHDPELEVEMEPPFLVDYALETGASERIVQVVAKISQELRGNNRLLGVAYGSDASKLARAGIPSIILGPGSIDHAHSADEYVELDQVALAAEIYARAILEF